MTGSISHYIEKENYNNSATEKNWIGEFHIGRVIEDLIGELNYKQQ